MLQRLATLLCLVALLLLVASPARAETVLFACSEKCPVALFEALELELRGHGALLVSRLDPSGFTVEAHEADARRVALLVPAAAVIWIEREPPLRVRVFSAKDQMVREAPLAAPPEAIEPRVFAAIAGNVVLTAMGAPGHGDVPAEAAPATAAAAAAAQPTTSARATSTPISESERAEWGPAKGEQRFQRFFLRAGAAIGFAFLKNGMSSDRPPSQDLVNSALAVQQIAGDPNAAKEFLKANGYDCHWGMDSLNNFIASDCNVALNSRGTAFSAGIDLQAGGYLTPRFALSGVLRITPDAGYGTLNHTLFGVQAEYALTDARRLGWWANVGFGFAFGRIQVQPASERKEMPYITSGPYESHALVASGYRFLPNFGLYATTIVRVLFPDTLWMLEPTLGVEARL